MIRKYRVLLLVIVVLVTITACSQNSSEVVNTENTKTVVDCAGRSVQIPENVERIGCLYTVSGHIVTMLDAGDKIVAVTNGLKRDKLLHKINPSITEAVTAKNSGAVNIEELLKVNPDVVFIDRVIGTNEQEKAKFDKFNIPYLIVDFHSIEEQQYLVEMIGQVICNEDKALEFNQFYDKIMNDVKSITDTIPLEERYRVYHSVNEVIRTDSSDSIGMEWTTIAGCINVSKEMDLEADGDDFYTNVEQILYVNPEVILVNEDGVDKYINEQPMFKTLEAVVEDRVFLLPTGISRWGHTTSIETVLAIPYTAKKLYPTYFEDMDIEALTKEYYNKFFNYDLSDDELSQLMSGKDMRLGKTETQ